MTTIRTNTEMKKAHQEEVNAFPMMFAFSKEQFEAGYKKIAGDSGEKVVHIGAGCYILKSKVKEYIAMIDRHEAERKQLRKDKTQLKNMFLEAMSNLEYCISEDDEEIFDYVGINLDSASAEQRKIFFSAKKKYMANVIY